MNAKTARENTDTFNNAKPSRCLTSVLRKIDEISKKGANHLDLFYQDCENNQYYENNCLNGGFLILSEETLFGELRKLGYEILAQKLFNRRGLFKKEFVGYTVFW